MKKVMILTILLVAMLSGCDPGFVGGAAAGGALSHTFAGVEADIKAERERLLIEAASAGELEKEILEKRIETLKNLETGINLGEKALTTNWSDRSP